MRDKEKEYVIIMSTCKNKLEAKKIAKLLLKARLVACVQLQSIESFYNWNFETVQADEIKLTIKTDYSLYKAVEEVILKHNSYDTPEIIVSKVVAGYTEYLHWLSGELE